MTPRSRRVLRGALELGLAALVVLAALAWRERGLLDRGEAAPDFRLQALDGSWVRRADLEGAPVVLHFWATWCGVCRLQLGEVASLAASGARVVAIADESDSPEDLRRFVQEHGVGYPVLRGTAAVQRAYGVSALPTDYFLDARGRVASRTAGFTTRFGLRARLWLAR